MESQIGERKCYVDDVKPIKRAQNREAVAGKSERRSYLGAKLPHANMIFRLLL